MEAKYFGRRRQAMLRYTDHYRLPEAVEKELNATFHHSR
jgi:hypothetical protein